MHFSPGNHRVKVLVTVTLSPEHIWPYLEAFVTTRGEEQEQASRAAEYPMIHSITPAPPTHPARKNHPVPNTVSAEGETP